MSFNDICRVFQIRKSYGGGGGGFRKTVLAIWGDRIIMGVGTLKFGYRFHIFNIPYKLDKCPYATNEKSPKLAKKAKID